MNTTWNLICVGGTNDGKTVTGLNGDVYIHGYAKTGEMINGAVVYKPLSEAGMYEATECPKSKNC